MGKTSKVWRLAKDEFARLFNCATSQKDLLIKIGLAPRGSNYKTLKKRIVHDGLDIRELEMRTTILRIERGKQKKTITPLEQILVKGSSYNNTKLKARLIKRGLLQNQCSICGVNNAWNNRPLSLQIDHINGDSTDNRIVNLRLLCPNCHSQTKNFAGKGARKYDNLTCKRCGCKITKYSTSGYCRGCHNKVKLSKVKERPSKEKLQKQVTELGYCATGRLYGVSDNTIRKWLHQEQRKITNDRI